jgi:hypothetical protein
MPMNQPKCASTLPAECASTLPADHQFGPLGPLYDLCARAADAHPRARARLREEGIDAAREAQIRAQRSGLFCGIAKVLPHGGKYFDFDEGGRWRFILPELFCEEIVDLIAFSPNRPQRVKTWCGMATMLGQEQIERSAFVLGKTALWDDPLQWLRAGCDGGMVLQFSPPPMLLYGTTIIASSMTLAERLEASFALHLQPPEIEVRQSNEVAA